MLVSPFGLRNASLMCVISHGICFVGVLCCNNNRKKSGFGLHVSALLCFCGSALLELTGSFSVLLVSCESADIKVLLRVNIT